MTDKQIDKLVDEKMSALIKGKPVDFVLAMLVKMGQMCVESNAATMDVKTEATIENKRYEVKAKIRIKQIPL